MDKYGEGVNMLIDSMLQRCSSGARSRQVVLAVASAMALSLPLAASAQDKLEPIPSLPIPPQIKCGAEVKAQLAQALSAAQDAPEGDQLAAENDLYAKYQSCVEDAKLIPTANFYLAARECSAAVSYVGSLYFEEMPCCGYDPQKRSFACPVKIKQTFGFGPAPLPGSREYVLHCVADVHGTWQPVGQDSVHLADAIKGQQPPWQFAVTAGAIWNLPTIYPMSGETRRARSILSWGLRPTGCEYKPIWGNVINYPIRLDQ
jgi:hypothetical protein